MDNQCLINIKRTNRRCRNTFVLGVTINFQSDINHLKQIPRVSYKACNSHSSPPPQWRWLRVDPITTFKVFTGLLDIDLNLLFLPRTCRGVRRHPHNVLEGMSHRRRRLSAFSVAQNVDKNISPSSLLTETSSTQFFPYPPTPPQDCTPPTNSPHL